MAFMSLEIIFFRKKVLLYFASYFFFSDELLSNFINDRSHYILSVFDKSAFKHILRAQFWLYGFKIVFRQNLTHFLFFVYLLLFLLPHKN